MDKFEKRYNYIRDGNVYIEVNTYADGGIEFYAAIGDNGGKYYQDMQDFDMDLDEAIAKDEAP